MVVAGGDPRSRKIETLGTPDLQNFQVRKGKQLVG
jgi:hypothetical protein